MSEKERVKRAMRMWLERYEAAILAGASQEEAREMAGGGKNADVI